MNSPLLILPWLFAIALALGDEVVMTFLLRREYEGHRSSWESDGKPRGVFWVPEECKIGRWYVTYASGHAGAVARWKWLFKMPEWIMNDSEARRLMVLHRVLLPAFVLCVIAPFLVAAAFQYRG